MELKHHAITVVKETGYKNIVQGEGQSVEVVR